MSKKTVAFAGILDSAHKKKDRSMKFTFSTDMELTGEELATGMEMVGDQAHFLIKPYENETFFTETEINKLDLPPLHVDVDEKTPSQRLRNVLYVLWEQTEKHKENGRTSDQFYRDQMERLVDYIKSKLQ